MPETDPMETMSPGDSQNDVWLIRWVARNASRAGVVVLNEGERDMLMRAASELATLRQQLTEVQADTDAPLTAFDVRRLYNDWRWKGLAPNRGRPVMGEEIDDSVAFGLYMHQRARLASSSEKPNG